MTDHQRQTIRRRLGFEAYRAILGDADGIVWDDPVNRPGIMRVRYATASGLSLPPLARIGSTYQGSLAPGTGVWIGWEDGELRVLRPDLNTQMAAGFNPALNHASVAARSQQATDSVVMFKSHPTSPISLYVVVRSWLYIESGTVKLFDASGDDGAGGFKGKIDLSSYVPTTGDHRLACLFLKPDNTIEVIASTTQSIIEPLDLTDLQECFDAASDITKPCWAWRLADGQTAIGDESSWLDLRQFINVDSGVPAGAVLTAPSADSDNVIQPTANTVTPLTVKGVASQADNLTEWKNSSNTLLASVDPSGNAKFNSYTTRFDTPTISSGAITFTSGLLSIAAQTGTADDLDTINSGQTGLRVVLVAGASHTITVKHGTGNIALNDGVDFVLTGNRSLELFYHGSVWSDIAPDSPPLAVCQCRLTTQTGIAVDTADRTGQSTIYLTPYKGRFVEVWDGTFRVRRTLSADISVAVPSTKFRLFDVFVYDSGGSLALETVNWNQSTGSITGATNAAPIVITSNSHGLSNGAVVAIDGIVGNTAPNGKLWVVANQTANTFELAGSTGNGAYTSGGTWYSVPNTRATGISLGANTGYYIKTGDETRRYLGTGMTGATSGQLDDSQANRMLWNYYNRVQRISVALLTTDHNYNSITTRFWNADGQSKAHFVIGVVEDSCHVGIGATMAVDANLNQAYLGAQLNGIAAITTGAFYVWSNTTYFNQNVVSVPQTPQIGFNFIAALQLVVSGTGYYYQTGSVRGDFWG